MNRMASATNLFFDQDTGLLMTPWETSADWACSEIKDPMLRLQVSLHDLLVGFLNATYISPLYSFLPLSYCKYPHTHNIQIALNAALELGSYPIALQKIATSNWYSQIYIAEFIAEGYSLLRGYLRPQNSISKVKSKLDRTRWFAELNRIELKTLGKTINYLRGQKPETMAAFWIHGSLATLDYKVGYSDCDTLAIITADGCCDAESLIVLQKYVSRATSLFHSVDPLQHHGIFVMSEIDLNSYEQSIFPLGILERGIELTDQPQVITFNENGIGYIGERDSFLSMTQLMRSLALGRNRLKTSYGIKAYIQTAVLMPAIYLQLRDGSFWHKPEALSQIRRELNPEVYRIIDIATELRSSWSYQSHIPSMITFSMTNWNPRLVPAINRGISIFEARKVLSILSSDWRYACLDLSEALLTKLRQAEII